MAIDINKTTEKIDLPSIKIEGQRVNNTEYIGGTGTYGGASDDVIQYSLPDVYIDTDTSSPLKIYKAAEAASVGPVIYLGDVTVTITQATLNTSITANSYSNRVTGDFVGATAPVDNKVAKYAETYYTTNGKDPLKTKSNLYTGAFTVRRNLSGSDNTIIKARTYCNGTWSDIQKIEFSIIRETANNV